MTATIHPAFRVPAILPVAGLVTVGLFLMMRQLIDIGPVVPEPVVEPPKVEIRFDIPEPDPVRTGPEVIREVEVPPRPPVIDTPRPAVDGVPTDVVWSLPPVDPPGVDAGEGLAVIDRPPSPTLRIEPVYPAGEMSRGRNGSCTAVFDITPEGRTANLQTRNCTSRAFERATLNAVSRWRYAPQVRDGEPVTYRGATTQLVFTLGE